MRREQQRSDSNRLDLKRQRRDWYQASSTSVMVPGESSVVRHRAQRRGRARGVLGVVTCSFDSDLCPPPPPLHPRHLHHVYDDKMALQEKTNA